MSVRTASARPTIRDVSRMAGVSFKTVSRVINNQQYVSEEKRRRVLDVMAEIGFQPSQAARALAGARSHQIALICDNPNPWYVYEIQAGVRERCSQNGVRMIAQPYDRASPTLLEDIVALVDQAHPDGLVLAPPACDDPRVIAELERRDIPYVRLQPGEESRGAPSTLMDNRRAAYDMTSYLASLGHRRLAVIVGDLDYAASEQRLSGHLEALQDLGIEPHPEYRIFGSFDFRSGCSAADALLNLADPPTAIVASNDDVAAGVLATAHRRGVVVPDQLSITGFDDSPLAQSVWPPLTTVRQPVRELAALAADALLNPTDELERRLDHQIVVRGTTASPRTD